MPGSTTTRPKTNGLSLWLATLLWMGCQDLPEPDPDGDPQKWLGATSSTPSSTAPPPPPPPPKKSWLESTLEKGDARFADWLKTAAGRRIQILLTDPDGKVHEFRVDQEYFYPASAIKTFLAVGALRTMNGLAGEEVHRLTMIRRCAFGKPGCEPPKVDERKNDEDEESEKKKHEKIRVHQEIRKLITFSDNDSYNRLWDIVGHQGLNEAMAVMNFSSVRFHHGMNTPADKSRRTRRVVLLVPGKKAITIKQRKSEYNPPPTPVGQLTLGKAHNKMGKGLVEEPMSFEAKNYVSLRDLQRMNISLIKPQHASATAVGLPEKQRELIIGAMTGRLKPRKLADDHKPLLPGVLEVLDAGKVRYIGKSGRAYGFHLENAYIENKDNGRGYFVSATIYDNPNGVLNDDDYGYDDTTRPFLAALGKVLTQALILE